MHQRQRDHSGICQWNTSYPNITRDVIACRDTYNESASAGVINTINYTTNLFAFEGCFRGSQLVTWWGILFMNAFVHLIFVFGVFLGHVVLTSNLPTELAASNSARTSCIVMIWAERRCITWSRRLKDCWILVSGVSTVSPPSYDKLKHSELPQSK